MSMEICLASSAGSVWACWPPNCFCGTQTDLCLLCSRSFCSFFPKIGKFGHLHFSQFCPQGSGQCPSNCPPPMVLLAKGSNPSIGSLRPTRPWPCPSSLPALWPKMPPSTSTNPPSKSSKMPWCKVPFQLFAFIKICRFTAHRKLRMLRTSPNSSDKDQWARLFPVEQFTEKVNHSLNPFLWISRSWSVISDHSHWSLDFDFNRQRNQ